MSKYSIRPIIVGFEVIVVLLGLLTAGFAMMRFFQLTQRATQESLEEQLTKTLKVLQANSQQAADLTIRLQSEVSNRTQALKDIEIQLGQLREQKTLLDLTPEQRNALQFLLKKSPTVRDIYTSSEFWFGNVFGNIITGILFFFIGIIYQRRRAARHLATAEHEHTP